MTYANKFIKKCNNIYSQGENGQGKQSTKSDDVGKENAGFLRHSCDVRHKSYQLLSHRSNHL